MRSARPCIGLVASDALRIEGIRSLLCDGVEFDVILLGSPRAADLLQLELVILDATAIDQLLGWIAAFCRLGPQARLIVIGEENSLEHTQQVIGAGARAYLNHGASAGELRGAVEAVRDGSVWAPRKVLARLLELARREAATLSENPVNITRRETEVLALLVLGHSNREIAGKLGVDEGTVKAHLGRLMRKANVNNRIALTLRALEDRWTETQNGNSRKRNR